MLPLRVPTFLEKIEDPRVAQGSALKGCPVCGGKSISVPLRELAFTIIAGLGHGISNCPKQEEAQRRQIASHRVQDMGGY